MRPAQANSWATRVACSGGGAKSTRGPRTTGQGDQRALRRENKQTLQLIVLCDAGTAARVLEHKTLLHSLQRSDSAREVGSFVSDTVVVDLAHETPLDVAEDGLTSELVQYADGQAKGKPYGRGVNQDFEQLFYREHEEALRESGLSLLSGVELPNHPAGYHNLDVLGSLASMTRARGKLNPANAAHHLRERARQESGMLFDEALLCPMTSLRAEPSLSDVIEHRRPHVFAAKRTAAHAVGFLVVALPRDVVIQQVPRRRGDPAGTALRIGVPAAAGSSTAPTTTSTTTVDGVPVDQEPPHLSALAAQGPSQPRVHCGKCNRGWVICQQCNNHVPGITEHCYICDGAGGGVCSCAREPAAAGGAPTGDDCSVLSQ
jgi:hypothetical protein